MQQLRLPSNSIYKMNNQKNIILCENCLISDKKADKICIYCLQLVCQQCAQNHQKHAGDLPLMDSKMKWIEILANKQEVNKYQLNLTQQSEALRDCKFTNKENCQRCQLKVASKICLNCSNRIFCLSCFNLLHSTQKFKIHKMNEFQKIESKLTEKLPIEVKIDQIIRKGHEQRYLIQGLKLRMKTDVQNYEIGDNIPKQDKKIHQINKNIVNLSIMKASISQTTHKMQKNYEQLFINIKRTLQQKIQEIKLKLLELQLKIKNKKDQIVEQNKQIIDQIGKLATNYKNLDTLLQNRQIVQLEKISQNKLQIVSKRYQSIKQKYQQILNRELQIKISQQFNIDMQILEDKINKIQYKRIIHKQEIKNTILMVSSPKSEKKIIYDFKSDNKTLKKSLNLTTCKSQKKVNPFLISQNNSQSNSKPRKISKNQNKFLESSPILLKSYATTPSDQMSINRTLFNIKSQKQSKKTDMTMKQIRSKGALQKSARFSNKTPFFDNKSGISKAMMNIETTKKMINEMRSQISEFPCYKFISTQSELLGNTDRQDQYSNQQIQQKLNISINSLLVEQETSV